MKLETPKRNYQQEMFYRCKDGLLAQGQKTDCWDGIYPLKDHNGNRCALGFLFDDDLQPCIKKDLIEISEHLNIPLEELEDIETYKLFLALQNLHDKIDVKDWPDSFDIIQENFKIPKRHYETAKTFKKLFARSFLPV